jgi:D-alanyl-D-alanine carboxypeptidase (penicillin-binding protein 5/6)
MRGGWVVGLAGKTLGAALPRRPRARPLATWLRRLGWVLLVLGLAGIVAGPALAATGTKARRHQDTQAEGQDEGKKMKKSNAKAGKSDPEQSDKKDKKGKDRKEKGGKAEKAKKGKRAKDKQGKKGKKDKGERTAKKGKGKGQKGGSIRSEAESEPEPKGRRSETIERAGEAGATAATAAEITAALAHTPPPPEGGKGGPAARPGPAATGPGPTAGPTQAVIPAIPATAGAYGNGTPIPGGGPGGGKVPPPPVLNARAYLLVDYESGAEIAEKNAEERIEPASLTKLMTLYVVAQEIAAGRLQFKDTVRVSEAAAKTGGSKMFLQAGTEVSVHELLQGLAIVSGNDAGVALAERVGGGNAAAFVARMNEEAARLGMAASHFANPTGLPDPGNYTTARDLSRLARALIHDHPEIYKLFAIKELSYNRVAQPNRNRLLWTLTGADGIKTGHTDAAGYCLVGSARVGEMRLISVLMGAATDQQRSTESQTLLEYGFRNYETYRIYEAGRVVTEARIWQGTQQKVALGLTEPLILTIPRSQYEDLQANVELAKRLIAPVEKGRRYGVLRVRLYGKDLRIIPLVAMDSVTAGTVVGRTVDGLRLLLDFTGATDEQPTQPQSQP